MSEKTKQERFRADFPIAFAFGPRPLSLTPEQAEKATPEERIQSVWPFLIRRVLNFQATLSDRERANFDLEDTMAELWIVLRERDHKWDPARGRFITFAARVSDNVLIRIRERARTIESPRNCKSRMKAYIADAQAGTLSPAATATLKAMARSTYGVTTIEAEDDRLVEDTMPLAVDEDDTVAARRSLVARAIMTLSIDEARVIGLRLGIWTGQTHTLSETAKLMRVSTPRIQRLLASGLAKLSAQITASTPIHNKS